MLTNEIHTPKPCHHCKWNAPTIHMSGPLSLKWVECPNCFMQGPHLPSAVEAVKAWNAIPASVLVPAFSPETCQHEHGTELLASFEVDIFHARRVYEVYACADCLHLVNGYTGMVMDADQLQLFLSDLRAQLEGPAEEIQAQANQLMKLLQDLMKEPQPIKRDTAA